MPFESNSIFWVEVEKISPNPFQPRREFDEARLRELADSIRMYGIMQPLTVTRKEKPKDDGGLMVEYELIAGERRLRASKLAGLSQVPVIIRSSEESERMKLELAIIENLQREDLNPVDRALAFKQLAEQFALSHSQVAKKVGRSREYVSNTMRLLLLPEVIMSAMRRGEITEGHGRALLMLATRPDEQNTLFREIVLKKLSVREVERITRKIAIERVRKKEWLNIDPELIEIEKQFTSTLGTRVQISRTDFGGKLVIDYFTQEDLRKILDVIAEGKQHVSDAQFAVPDIPPNPGIFDNQNADTSLLLAKYGQYQQTESGVETLVSETIADVPVQESVDAPLDDRTHTEQVEIEKNDDEDPDLYTIKNFVV